MVTDCKSHKVVVKGEKADPLKVVARVQKKSHRQVELISPIPPPPPPADEAKKPPEEAVKPEEKKEEVALLLLLLIFFSLFSHLLFFFFSRLFHFKCFLSMRNFLIYLNPPSCIWYFNLFFFSLHQIIHLF